MHSEIHCNKWKKRNANKIMRKSDKKKIISNPSKSQNNESKVEKSNALEEDKSSDKSSEKNLKAIEEHKSEPVIKERTYYMDSKENSEHKEIMKEGYYFNGDGYLLSIDSGIPF